jgi:hypothetical protein
MEKSKFRKEEPKHVGNTSSTSSDKLSALKAYRKLTISISRVEKSGLAETTNAQLKFPCISYKSYWKQFKMILSMITILLKKMLNETLGRL